MVSVRGQYALMAAAADVIYCCWDYLLSSCSSFTQHSNNPSVLPFVTL